MDAGSRAFVEAILDSVVDGIIAIDEAGIIHTANPAVERIFGYPAAELIGLNVSVLMPEPDRSAADEYVAGDLQSGESPIVGIGRELTGRRRDGTLFPMELSIGEFRTGGRRHFTGVIRDISERKRGEEAASRLAAIVESSDDAIIGKDLDGLVTSWNAGAERIFGYAVGEMLGRPIRLLIPDERQDEEAEILRRIRLGERVDHFDSVRVTKDGRRIDVSLTISPIRDATGRVIGASKIARDITERRHSMKDGRWATVDSRLSLVRMADGREQVLETNRDVGERKIAEDALRRRLELQQQLAMIAASVPGVICAFRMRPDGTTSMPFAMPAIEDLYGIPAKLLADDVSPVYANVHPDDARQLAESLQEAFQRSDSWHKRFRYLHPAKGLRWIEGWSKPQAETDGSVLWHGFLMDVTDRETAEKARRDYERIARSILDAITSPIALVDDSGTILDVNRAWREFAEENGAWGEVFEGADYLGVCDSATGESRETAKAFAAGLRGVLAGELDSFELEYPCHSPSQRRWFIGRVSPFAEDGPRGAVVTHQSITRRRLVEEQLLKSTWMLGQSQRMAHVGSWELDIGDPSDLRRSALRWSDECYRIFGHEPGRVAVTYDLFLDSVHPADRDRVQGALVRAVREDGAYAIEHGIVLPDGTERSVAEWGEVIDDSGGRPIRVIGTCQDITERKRAEVALERHAKRLEDLRAIDRAILSSHSSREIAGSALEYLSRHVNYWTAGIALFDPIREELEVLANDGLLGSWHPPGTRLQVDLERWPELRALRQGPISGMEDVRDADLDSPVLGALRDAGMKSFVLLPLLERGLLFGTLLLASDRPAAFSREQVEVAREVADHVAIAVRQAQLFDDVKQARSRLADLSRRLIQAQEDERRHIARELHDEIGQALTAVKICFQGIQKGDLDGDQIDSRAREGISLVERTLRQIRSISLDLRPSLLDDFGLVTALRSYVGHQARMTGYAGRFEVVPAGLDFRLETGLETTCFRVAQEALTNIARYAGARNVVVELARGDDQLTLLIRDDGSGFDLAEARSRAAVGTHLGLLGMEERVSLARGRLRIHSTLGAGTAVFARFPLSTTSLEEEVTDEPDPRAASR